MFDPGGRLVLCQHGDRRVARLEAEGRFATRADRYQGQRFNSPNDAVFKANGDLISPTRPMAGAGGTRIPKKELPFNGVYRLAKDGTVTLLTREMTFPNGLAFAPDEETLYGANSDPNRASGGRSTCGTTARWAKAASSATPPRWPRARRACPTA